MLSKSLYIRGLQCEKSLWLYKHQRDLLDKPSQEAESLFHTGIDVGDLAKSLFPGGVEIDFNPNDFDGMVTQTAQLLSDGQKVIYEAAFKQNDIFIMVDILVKSGRSWDIYEVKSSTRVKDVHIDDTALQWFALSDNLKLGKAFVIHIDNSYIRNGELVLEELFKIQDITALVKESQKAIKPKIKSLNLMIKSEEPIVNIGPHCHSPYPCDFIKHCWRTVPTPSVFNLYRMYTDKKFKLYHEGIIQFEDLTDEHKLSKIQSVQVESSLSNTPFIDKPKIMSFLSELKYPLSFFDFETFQNAIPRFDSQKPYQQMPFQYSLHILQEDGLLEHKEFLGDDNSDPREELISQMLADIPTSGSILAYNQGFEKGQIKGLAEYFPKRKKELLALNSRFADLLVPFQKLGYYHPDFNGSFSIKSVLPAIFPGDDELDYKKLEIQNGGMAMDTFANLYLLKNIGKREKIRKDLLAYCRLDTLAMVRLWEFLIRKVKS